MSLRALPLVLAVSLIAGTFSRATLASAQEFPKPGPEHALLKEFEGTWSAVTKMPDGHESKGEMTYKMELGGLWLASHFTSDFGGLKFEGRGMDGYDPIKKKFVAVWFDSMITTPMTFEGDLDKDKQTSTMWGEGKSPEGKAMKFKSVNKVTDKDHHTFTMYTVDADGKENLMMTIEYTRKK